MKTRLLMAAAAVAVVTAFVAVAVVVLTDSDEGADSSAASEPESAGVVAARVVETMYSFDHTTAGPNAWLEDARPDLTEEAYAYFAETLGPGDGPTDTEFWQQLVAEEGHQRVTAGEVRPDPDAETTNTDIHVTVMVPFDVDAQGIESPLAHGDRVFYVNLDRPTPEDPWKVAVVMPTTALMDDYPTRALTPEN